jgi:ABC-type glycerol-3-phosphate transport system substrate-binding protein
VQRPAVKERVTVTYWEKWTGWEGEAMRKIVDDFNASQDRIYVKMLTISAVNDKTLLAANGGNPPDVAGLWGEQVAQFADAKAIMELDDLAKEFGIKQSDYIPVYWDIMSYKGKLVALPTTPATTALHVNPEKTPAEFNTPEKFPKTLEEFDELVDKGSSKGDEGKLKFAYFLPSEPGWWNWAWGCFFGGSLVGKNGDLTIDSEENIRGFTWVGNFAKKFGVQEIQTFQSGFGSFSSPQNAFIDSKVGSVLQGVWMGNFINLYNKKLKWFAVPFPYPKDRPDLKNVSFAGMDTLMIPRGAKHPREAFEFMAFVQSQKEMEKLCTLHGKNSPLTKVSEDFLKNHPNPYIKLFDELARTPNAIHTPNVGIWPELSQELTNTVQEINLGTKTPKKALQDAQERMAAAWIRYKRANGVKD